jgi:hypothetical protein
MAKKQFRLVAVYQKSESEKYQPIAFAYDKGYTEEELARMTEEQEQQQEHRYFSDRSERRFIRE